MDRRPAASGCGAGPDLHHPERRDRPRAWTNRPRPDVRQPGGRSADDRGRAPQPHLRLTPCSFWERAGVREHLENAKAAGLQQARRRLCVAAVATRLGAVSVRLVAVAVAVIAIVGVAVVQAFLALHAEADLSDLCAVDVDPHVVGSARQVVAVLAIKLERIAATVPRRLLQVAPLVVLAVGTCEVGKLGVRIVVVVVE